MQMVLRVSNIKIIESDVKYLCAFKYGWTPKFYKDFVIIASPDSAPYAIPLETIQEGDILPRDCDEVYKIRMWDVPKVMDE